MAAEVRDIIIDYESLSLLPNAAVIELGAVSFVNNPEKIPTYAELISNSFRAKFIISTQKGHRDFNKETVEWWKSQKEEAKQILIPSSIDVTVEEGHRMFVHWLDNQAGYTKKSHLWCRGNNFDIPVLSDCLRQTGINHPVIQKYGSYRDIRTAIESYMGRDVTTAPLPKNTLYGFVHHNGVHDCAKDVMMLLYSKRYSFGLSEIPTKENMDENAPFF